MGETAIVVAIVAACAAWLGLRAWRTLRGKRTGCGCEKCPAVVPRAPARPPQDGVAP
jgi:hypothetical protein